MPSLTPVQSGRASAVGFCIESTWRAVPTTGTTTLTIGVTNTNPHRFLVLDPSKGFSIKPTIDVAEKEITGDFEIHRTILQAKSYDGDFTWKFDPENSYFCMLGVMGRDVQTQVATAGSGVSVSVYSHAMTPNSNRGWQPSFTIEEIFGDQTHGRLTTGCIFVRAQLTFSKTIMINASVYGYRQIPNSYPNAAGARTDYDFGSAPAVLPGQMGGNGTATITRTATPTYVDVPEQSPGNGPAVFAGMTYGSQGGQYAANFMTVDGVGVAIDILEGSTFTVERIVERFQTAGSDYDMGATAGDEWKASGKLDILYRDNFIPLAVLRHSKVGLNFKVVGAAIGTGTNQNYAIEVFVPNANFLEGAVEIPATAMMTGGNYQAKKDVGGLNYSCQVTLTNTVNNAVLAGQQILTTAPIVNNASATITVNNTIGVVAADTIQINGATSNPYTVASTTATTITFSGNVQAANGTVASGAGCYLTNRTFGPGSGLGGWSST